jgi:serine/threonine-protein kinase
LSATREDLTDGTPPEATAPTVSSPVAPRRRRRSQATLGIAVAPGERIDRYVVQEEIGAGGMGVVFKALDPELGRAVAIKLLQPGAGADTTDGRARLVRESQAIAQLAHPNVVAVHDIGEFKDGLLFVAMEYVPGRSLRAWLAERTRSLAEILAVFVQAGRGLAAAHAKGLVHRDFKPDNVLVGDDGRVRVVDFGLARFQHDAEAEPASAAPSPERERSASLSSPLTRPGHVMGTPAYMAPELYRGERGDARTDQFAFCVSLYQALTGQRPFPEAARSPDTGAPIVPAPPMPADAGVPAWLERVVLRGLALDASGRFDTMGPLLAELERDRGGPRRIALVTGSVVVALALGAVGTRFMSKPARPCADAGAPFSQVWNDDARGRVRARFLATGRPYAADTFARVDAAFARYGAEWAAMSVESCKATRVRRVQSEHHLDLRSACLGRRLSELRALVGVLAAEADAASLDRATQAAYGLTPVAACAADVVLATEVAPPRDPAARPRVEALRAELDRAHALQTTGRYKEGLALAAQVVAQAETIDYPPLVGEAKLRLGALQQKNGAPKDAEKTLLAALEAASAGKDHLLVARVLTELVWVVGYEEARYDEGWVLYQAASAMAHLTDGDVVLQAQLVKNVGTVLYDQGKYDEARRYDEQGLALVVGAFGDEHPYVATSLNSVGAVLAAQGKTDEALDHFRRALAIGEKVFGPDHPLVTDYLNNIGAMLGDQDHDDEARAYFERAAASLERTVGKDHVDLAYPLFNIGNGLVNQGRYAEAVPYDERALAIRVAALGETHPHVAYPLMGLGRCRLELGQVDEALGLLERAVTILAASESDPNPLAQARFALAQALWKANRDRGRALALAKEARRTWADPQNGRWSEELAEVDAWLGERER